MSQRTISSHQHQWSVHLIAQAPEGMPEPPPGDKRTERLVDLLSHAHGASVTVAGSAVDILLPVQEIDPVHDTDEAGFQAQQWVAGALDQVGLDGWEIGPWESVPDLVGTQEVTNMLGITRQRLHELRLQERFPTPATILAGGPVWLRSAVEAFAKWNRRPGRPVKPCTGMVVKHADGTRTCVVCTAASGDPLDETVHIDSKDCGGCPVCISAT
jgi:predicted DNA-binding transcriptional regulator AlpA